MTLANYGVWQIGRAGSALHLFHKPTGMQINNQVLKTCVFPDDLSNLTELCIRLEKANLSFSSSDPAEVRTPERVYWFLAQTTRAFGLKRVSKVLGVSL